MKPELVLPNDFEKASALNECCLSCLNRARLELSRDNIDDADRWVTEYHRCKRDLDKLISKRKQYNKMLLLSKDLKRKGIKVEVIKKLTATNSENKK
ncbi:hypothetical protein [Cytobacillus kochii]|uniref:hypothetical protein n=1 Tax=Cytobacillus kochii TaxID=859143 RepID=UPI00402AF995